MGMVEPHQRQKRKRTRTKRCKRRIERHRRGQHQPPVVVHHSTWCNECVRTLWIHFQTGTDFFCLVAGWPALRRFDYEGDRLHENRIYLCLCGLSVLCVIKRTNERLCGTLVIVRNFEKNRNKNKRIECKMLYERRLATQSPQNRCTHNFLLLVRIICYRHRCAAHSIQPN